MPLPVSFYTLSVVDYTKERSSVNIPVTTLTAGNIVAQQTSMSALRAAIQALILGLQVQESVVYNRVNLGAPGLGAATKQAQRENKWLIRYYDAVDFTQYSFEIPTADLSLLPTASDHVNLVAPVAGPWTAFKTALESVMVSPNGNAIVATEAIFVGRNI
jgi:hypothetical protein